MGYEYGNARVAALRGRLLDRGTLARLGESGTPAALVTQLERYDDWTATLRQATGSGDAVTTLDTAVELHRSARWGALPAYYDGRPRRLVEALVLPLDQERTVAVLRRRRGGEPSDEIASSVLPGALLGARDLARLARGEGAITTFRPLVERGVLGAGDARALESAEGSLDSAELESMLAQAFDRARRQRVAGRGDDAVAVRRLLDEERDQGEAVIVELLDSGPTVATLLERSTRLAQLDALARLGRRDPLGVGTVAGYLAAVELQAVRLRAAIARVRSAWTAEDSAPYFATSERSAWLASSS